MNMSDIITKKRLKRMCRYFKNKKITISYEYNNSLGHHSYRYYNGYYDSFTINAEEMICNPIDIYFTIIFEKKNRMVFEQSFYSYIAEFTGLGKIRELNDGPYCYFRIYIRYNIFNRLWYFAKSIFKKIGE